MMRQRHRLLRRLGRSALFFVLAGLLLWRGWAFQGTSPLAPMICCLTAFMFGLAGVSLLSETDNPEYGPA